MDIEARLRRQKDELMAKIKTAAETGDTAAVLASGQSLAAVDRLTSELIALVREVESIENPAPHDHVFPPPPESLEVETVALSDARSTGRSRGDMRRIEFIKTLPPGAQPRIPTSAATYVSRSGVRMGIAYSKEGRTNRWFLGLKDGACDHAVLLCESHAGRMVHFSLGRDFLAKYRKPLTTNGQMKCNVSRNGGIFYLVVPRVGRINIEAFRDNFCGLR